MAYVPKNIQVYSAAFAGAMAGAGIPNGAFIIDPTVGDYAAVALVAAAFAQAVDTAWGNVTVPNSYDLSAIVEGSSQLLQRGSYPLGAPTNTQANWTVAATALVAMVQEGDANFGTQNITPPGISGSNRAYGAGGSTTAGQATITVVAAAKLIAKGSGIFKAGVNLQYNLAAADVGTMTIKVFTDAVAGTPLTLGNNGSIGFGSNGVAQPGNVAVNNNGVFTANAGAGITVTGASAGYTEDTKVITEGTAAVNAIFTWDNVIGVAAAAAGAESPVPVGQTCLVTVSLTNSVAARATGNISLYLYEL